MDVGDRMQALEAIKGKVVRSRGGVEAASLARDGIATVTAIVDAGKAVDLRWEGGEAQGVPLSKLRSSPV